MKITRSQINRLSAEAGAAGDFEQVAICERALAGDTAAIAECTRVIDAAQAQIDHAADVYDQAVRNGQTAERFVRRGLS